MKEKTITIPIPEGYDDAELVEGKIIFKKKKATPWRHTNPTVQGFYVAAFISGIKETSGPCPWNESNENIFATKKQAKSMLAMAQLSQIIANDERFGGSITDIEWENETIPKHVIVRSSDELRRDFFYKHYHFLSFHTSEQRDLFLKENEDLIKQYYMLD